MKTRFFIPCILLALVTAALSQTGGAEWTKYSGPDGKFSVRFPGEPKEETKNIDTVVVHSVLLVQKPVLYMLVYSDYPDAAALQDNSLRLKVEKDNFLASSHTTLVSEREFSFKKGNVGLPALEFRAESADVELKSIVILDGSRVYFMNTGCAKGSNSQDRMQRFLGSLELK